MMTDKDKNGRTDRRTDRHTGEQKCKKKMKDRRTERQTERQTVTNADAEENNTRERERERQRDRDTERQRDRETETERQRDRDRETETELHAYKRKLFLSTTNIKKMYNDIITLNASQKFLFFFCMFSFIACCTIISKTRHSVFVTFKEADFLPTFLCLKHCRRREM